MQKKIISKMLAVVLCIVLVVSSTSVAFANYVTASLIGNNVSSLRWMSTIDDNTKLTDISIPGTHDSGTKWIGTAIAGAWTTTQDLTIPQQFEAGVRYIDIRLAYDSTKDGSAKVVHSSIECLNEYNGNMTFKDVCRYLKNFFDANPTETVIVSVKEDAGNAASALSTAILNTINSTEYSKYWYTGSSVPTLGNVRGKAVLAPRISQLYGGIHLDWGDQGSDGSYVDNYYYKIQDRYSMGADAKWENAAKPLLDAEKKSGIWHINFMSTTGGGIAGVSANASTMNSYFSRYEAQNNKCYGIVIFDYVSENLAKKVFKCNDLVSKNQPNNANGQYYYRVNLNTSSNVADGWSSVWMKLYYKENNGTGAEKSITLFENGDEYNGYHFVCNIGNFDFSGVVNGFPTRVEFHYDWGYGAKTLAQGMNLYVSKAPNAEMTKCATNNFVASSSSSTPCKGTEFYYTNSGIFPRVDTIDFYSGDSTLYAPQENTTAINPYLYFARVLDQYGVNWYKPVEKYTLSEALPGITISGNTISVDRNANDNPNDKQISINAEYSSFKGSKTLTLKTNKLSYQFVNADGQVLQTGSEYAGTSPVYNGETPTMASTQSAHYVFSGWDNKNPISMENKIYTAKYTQSQHSVSRVENTKAPTCTEKGYNTYFCDCGYSWQVDVNAIGHNMIEESKPATCLEDGYYRIKCFRCGYVQLEQNIDALGHDIENAVEGEYVPATSTRNGYQTYVCPRDNVEIIELREYDANDWSGYYEALNGVEDIKNDSSYGTYSKDVISQFESEINSARLIENYDEKEVLQNDIDLATQQILTAIDNFGTAVGVTYYNIVFIKNDGTVISTRYKAGTPANEVSKPVNTPYLITQTNHTVYKWGNVKAVTGNASYKEYAVTSEHSFNTFIFPDEVFEISCTQDGKIVHKCLCGYTYTEKTGDALGHNYAEAVSNGDGTHTLICSNDENHKVTELCSLVDGKCDLCKFSLDKGAFDAVVIEAQAKLNGTNIYTESTLNALNQALEAAIEGIKTVRTQNDVDNLVANIQIAINNLSKMPYQVQFIYSYIDSGEYGYLTSKENYTVAGVKTFELPENVVGNVYKWATMAMDGDEAFAVNSRSFEYDINKDVVIICYLTEQLQESTQSKVTFVGKGIKTVKYIENAAYSIDITDNSVIIGEEEIVSDVPFYNLDSITINGIKYRSGDEINISSDIQIELNYIAK